MKRVDLTCSLKRCGRRLLILCPRHHSFGLFTYIQLGMSIFFTKQEVFTAPSRVEAVPSATRAISM